MKTGRNNPCPCGSGQKYKKCCLNKINAYTFLISPHHFDNFNCHIRLTDDDTLCSLHYHIQEALDWDNDHMFSFFMDNKIWSRKAEYSANPFGEGSADICLKNILNLDTGKKFAYVFDYGDEHCFEVKVVKIEQVEQGDNSKSFIVGVIEKQGEAPQQYESFDEDYDEEYDDEEYDDEDFFEDSTRYDCLENNLESIKQLASQNKDKNWKFRSFLKMYDGEKNLDKLIHTIHDKVYDQIDCTKCANCCHKSTPVLKKSDLANLANSLNLHIDKFKEKYLEKDNDGDLLFAKRPCPLLKENKCSQYDCRPNDCKSFPHLHKSDFITRLWGVVENYGICPVVFNSYELLKEEFPNWQRECEY